MIAEINNIIQFDSKDALIKTLLYMNLVVEKKYKLTDNELNVLMLYTKNKAKDEVISEAIERKFVLSWQSGENTCSNLVKRGLLVKLDKKKRQINPDIFPDIPPEHIAATYKLHNLKLV